MLDQDEYIATLRQISSPELTGEAPDKLATKSVADQFVSLRGALAYTLITQAWIMVYVVSLQRITEPTNLHVRKLNAVVSKLQHTPRKIVFRAMTSSPRVDIQTETVDIDGFPATQTTSVKATA